MGNESNKKLTSISYTLPNVNSPKEKEIKSFVCALCMCVMYRWVFLSSLNSTQGFARDRYSQARPYGCYGYIKEKRSEFEHTTVSSAIVQKSIYDRVQSIRKREREKRGRKGKRVQAMTIVDNAWIIRSDAKDPLLSLFFFSLLYLCAFCARMEASRRL